MTRQLVLVLTLTALGRTALEGDELAAPPNSLTAAEKEQGWQLLFDGKTLDGWMSWRTKQPLEEGKWVAKDGTLQLAERGGGDIYTSDAFENFELSLQWKTTGNSGIFIRVDPEQKGAIYSVAPEIQIEKKNAGQLYALYPMPSDTVIHPDGWNHVRMRMVDGHGTHWFNGQKVYEYQIGSDDWNQRVANSKFKNQPTFGLNANGPIGLQDHGASVSFRNIKIRLLEGAE